MVLTATGAWFSASDSKHAEADGLNFGVVALSLDNPSITREECLQTLVVDKCSWETEIAFDNTSTVDVFATWAYSYKVQKLNTSTEEYEDIAANAVLISAANRKDGVNADYTGADFVADFSLAEAEAHTLRYLVAGAEPTFTIPDIEFDSDGAANGLTGTYQIVVAIEVKMIQADHATPAAVLEKLGLTVTAEQMTTVQREALDD